MVGPSATGTLRFFSPPNTCGGMSGGADLSRQGEGLPRDPSLPVSCGKSRSGGEQGRSQGGGEVVAMMADGDLEVPPLHRAGAWPGDTEGFRPNWSEFRVPWSSLH